MARGPSEAVRRLAVALGLKYRKTSSGDFEHGTTIYLVDREGVIRHIQAGIGSDKQEALAMLKRLAQ